MIWTDLMTMIQRVINYPNYKMKKKKKQCDVWERKREKNYISIREEVSTLPWQRKNVCWLEGRHLEAVKRCDNHLLESQILRHQECIYTRQSCSNIAQWDLQALQLLPFFFSDSHKALLLRFKYSSWVGVDIYNGKKEREKHSALLTLIG